MLRYALHAPTSETLIFLSNQILNRHLGIFKRDVGCPGAPHSLAVHAPSADTLTPLNQEQRDTTHARPARPDGSGKVVGPDTVGDPLLLSIDNIVLPIIAQLGLAGQVRNVRTGIGLGDGQADPLVSGQDAGKDAVNDALLTKLDEGRAADAEATYDVPDEASRGGTRQFIGDHQLMEKVPLLGGNRGDAVGHVLAGVAHSQEAGQVAPLAHLLVDFRGDLLLLVPLCHVGLDGLLHPLPHFSTQGGMTFFEVWRVILRDVNHI